MVKIWLGPIGVMISGPSDVVVGVAGGTGVPGVGAGGGGGSAACVVDTAGGGPGEDD